MNKKVSVIMAAYNESNTVVTESIGSILNQTHTNLELIIVCDNPSNYILIDKLKEFTHDSRVKLFINHENKGPAYSRNRAIKEAVGDYLAIMDADDISILNRFEKQVAYLENHPECCMVASNRDNIDENDKIIKKSASFIVSDKALGILSKYCSLITHSSIMTRTSIVKELGSYRLSDGEEYDLWLRMLSAGYKLHIMPEVLIKYRIRTNGITRINHAKQYYSTQYIKNLYKERMHNSGKDSCNQITLTRLQNHDKQAAEEINKQYLQLMALSKKEHIFYNIANLLIGAFRHPVNFQSLLNHLRIRILIKLSSILCN